VHLCRLEPLATTASTARPISFAPSPSIPSVSQQQTSESNLSYGSNNTNNNTNTQVDQNANLSTLLFSESISRMSPHFFNRPSQSTGETRYAPPGSGALQAEQQSLQRTENVNERMDISTRQDLNAGQFTQTNPKMASYRLKSSHGTITRFSVNSHKVGVLYPKSEQRSAAWLRPTRDKELEKALRERELPLAREIANSPKPVFVRQLETFLDNELKALDLQPKGPPSAVRLQVFRECMWYRIYH